MFQGELFILQIKLILYPLKFISIFNRVDLTFYTKNIMNNFLRKFSI